MSFLSKVASIKSKKSIESSGATYSTQSRTASFLNIFGGKIVKSSQINGGTSSNIAVDANSNGIVNNVSLSADKYVTKSALLNTFDTNKDGSVSLTEFESKKNSVNWSAIQTMNIQYQKDANGAYSPIYGANGQILDRQSALNIVLDTFQKTESYLKSLGLNVSAPQSIVLGNNGAGSFASSTTWFLSSVTTEVIANKTIQTSLSKSYPKLGYTGLEAFSLYYTNNFLTKAGQSELTIPASESKLYPGQWIYRNQLEPLTGNNITQAYTDLNAKKITDADLKLIRSMVSNNNVSIYLSIKDVDPATIKYALDQLASKSNPTGADILSAVVKADQTLNGGKNYSTIAASFKSHGISA